MRETLKSIESNTWAEHDSKGKPTGNRKILFQILGVPKILLDQFLFTQSFIEVRGEIKTIESLRSFNSLPRWMKNRIKFRLRHPNKENPKTTHECIIGTCKCHSPIKDFTSFVQNL